MSIFRIKIPHGHTTFTDMNLGAIADNISSEGIRLFSIRADNTLNVSADSYVKLYTISSPIVGTTSPTIILRVAANSIVTQTFSFGSLPGLFLPNNLSIAAVTMSGIIGNTPPTNPLTVSLTVSYN